MSMSDLSYDIEQLYIDGLSAKSIARILDCPVEMVLGWIESQSVADLPQEELDPYNTINS
jgi:hypothetical protein